MEPLSVVGTGLVCAVGWDADTACASIRVGFNRLNPVSYFEVDDEDSIFPAKLMVANLEGLTDGYSLLATWVRMMQLATTDLVRKQPQQTLDAQHLAIVLITPPMEDFERLGADEGIEPDTVRDSLADAFHTAIALPVAPERIHCVCQGSAGIASALQQASALLSEPEIEQVMVIGVDCFVDPTSLAWLLEHERLKTEDNPVGITPGEACAAILLQRATKLTPPALGSIIQISQAQEDNHLYTEETNIGKGLSHAVKQLTNTLPAPFKGHIISDHNGEEWKAMELGSMISECNHCIDNQSEFLYPLVSTGEIGASYGPLAICLAAHTFSRGYNQTNQTLILASNDRGLTAAVLFNGNTGG